MVIPSEAILSKIVDRDDGFQMPPPGTDKRPKKAQKRRLQTKIVLEEEVYIDALSQIIERDYFPDTAKLRRHLDLLNARDGNDLSAISALHQQILTEQRMTSSTPSSTYPTTSGRPHPVDDCSLKFSEQISESATTVQTNRFSVDEFLREYTSEDNESFEVLQQRDVERRRRARHWAYGDEGSAEGDDVERKAGMLMLYHMDGKVLTVKERNRIDAYLELPQSIGDDRPNNLDTWRFRVRNQLMFPPSIEDSRCETSFDMMENANTSDSGAIMDGVRSLTDNCAKSSSSTQQLSSTNVKNSHMNKWVGASARAAKIIQRGNTSLRHQSDTNTTFAHSGITPSPLEAAHTPSVISESFSDSSSVTYHEGERVEEKKPYKILSMTPSPMPGGGGESPLMTWGLVGGTPLILDPPEMSSSRLTMDHYDSAYYQPSLQSMGLEPDPGGYSGTMYQPPAMQARDILSHTLGSREKARKALMKEKETIRLNASRSRSSSLRRSGSGHSRTPNTRNQINLTPAAQSLAARLSGKGGDSSLRQSLNAHSGSTFGSDALTLSYSRPPSGVRSNKDVASRPAVEKSGSGRGSETPGATPSSIQLSMNTDNLLNI